ncbi:MAG: hypothetical protein R2762_01580 [Bryobacteraceae bacterium]
MFASAARPFHVSVPDRKVGKFDLNVTQGRGALNLVAENGSTAALRNTDADGNAGLELTLPPGEYTLAATSPTAPPPAFALRGSLRTPPECRVEELAAGDPVAGVIESTDCRYFEIAPFSTANTFARQHRFTLGERSRISLTMDSTEIEPVMVLFDANERGLAVGVAPAPGPLRLTGILPAGVYRVVVTAARGGLGAYTIGLQSEAAPEAAPAASPVSIFASSPADTVAAQKFTAASPDSPLRVTAARPIKAKSPRPTDPPTAR